MPGNYSFSTETVLQHVICQYNALEKLKKKVWMVNFRVCSPTSLDAEKVKDSIVVCVPGNTFGLYYPEEEVHAKGGIASIIVDDDLKSYAQVFTQPSVTTVSVGVGKHILAYINSTR